MNIFFTDPNPVKCAKFLDNKRMVKMCLETTQIICTVLNNMGYETPYKSTHLNHPCTKWAGETVGNFLWLYEHACALFIEYSKRYKKIHKCQKVLNNICLMDLSKLPIGEFSEPPNCTIYKDEKNTCKAYKKYLEYKWSRDKVKPTWRSK